MNYESLLERCSMKLVENHTIIDNLCIENKDLADLKLRCWIIPQNDFDIYIFSLHLTTEKILLETWDFINNIIAVHFQSSLKKDIERWNIYISFFVAEEINKDIKYMIEQDKYSTRKLIFDRIDEPDLIPAIINKKLFSLNCEFKDDLALLNTSVELLLQEQDHDLLKVLKIDDLKPKDRLEKYIEVLNEYKNQIN